MQAILDATASQGEPIQELLVTHGKVCWGHRPGPAFPPPPTPPFLPIRSTSGAFTSLWVVHFSSPREKRGVCYRFDFAPLLDRTLAHQAKCESWVDLGDSRGSYNSLGCEGRAHILKTSLIRLSGQRGPSMKWGWDFGMEGGSLPNLREEIKTRDQPCWSMSQEVAQIHNLRYHDKSIPLQRKGGVPYWRVGKD